MYLEIYIDELFLINFAMDIVLLLIEKKLLKWNAGRFKIVLASLFGAGMTCLYAVVPSLYGIMKFICFYVLVSFAMVRIAFDLHRIKDRIKGVVVLYAITFFLGGVMNSVYYQRKTIQYYTDLVTHEVFTKIGLPYLFGACILAVIMLFGIWRCIQYYRQCEKDILELNITYNKQSVLGKGLLDTGNCLKDPITGKPVIVVQLELLRECLSPSLYNDIIKVGRLENAAYDICEANATKIRLVPFQSIGKKHGILPAIVLDEVEIQRGTKSMTSKHVVAALYDDTLSTKNEYQVILHKSFAE